MIKSLANFHQIYYFQNLINIIEIQFQGAKISIVISLVIYGFIDPEHQITGQNTKPLTLNHFYPELITTYIATG
jgi:hypothetical protein